MSVHGVALSLGSAEGVNHDHLDRVAAIVDDFDACLVSEHLAWSRTGGVYYNDLLVSAANVGTDIDAWLDRIPADAIGEIHLAGHEVAREATHAVLIDTHGCEVSDDVWSLYASVIARFGPKPTLIEWDSNLPALDTLLNEAAHARDILLRTRRT